MIANLSGEFHSVYTFEGHGMAVDRCRETGIGAETQPYTGFGIAIADMDSDGDDEVMTVNGRVVGPNGTEEDKSDFWAPYREPIQILSVLEGRYEHVDWGAASQNHVARGLSIGDLDNDGDVDAVITTLGESTIVLRNDSVRAGHWIAFRATDPGLGGRTCPGARFHVYSNAGEIIRTLQPCQSFASTHQDFAIFQQLCQSYDPDGRFQNDWTSQLLTKKSSAVER